MGKRNIRFDYSPEVVRNDRPVVYVIRRPIDDRPHAGLIYRINDRLADILANISSDKLEQISRDIANHDVKELFEYTSGMDVEEKPLFGTFRPDDPEEFIL